MCILEGWSWSNLRLLKKEISMVVVDDCEYCRKKGVPICPTPEVGWYCKECLELVIDNAQRAIEEIENFCENLN
jgi:hypothetical protein